MSRIHLSLGPCAELDGAHDVPCNRGFMPADATTLDRAAVTCGNCRRWIAQHPEAPPAEPFEPGPAYPVLRKRWEYAEVVRRSIEGDDEWDPEREVFYSVGHALREWARWRHADVASVKGSSWARLAPSLPGEEPRRRGSSTRLDRKLRTHRVELAVLESCSVGHAFAGGKDGSGALALTPDACLDIVYRRAMGEDASRFAEVHGATPVQCGGVWKRVRREVEAALCALRLLRTRTRAEHTTDAPSSTTRREGDEMALLPDGFDVDGWKQVASTIGYSESHCRAMARAGKDPLPVSEMRGRIVAKSGELRSWLSRQLKPKQGAA